MIKRYITFFAICHFICGIAQNDSSIDFIIKNVGINVDGHFNSFQINATFNSSKTLIAINGEIDVTSLETGIESRDEHLLEQDYFDVKDHPKITLKSHKITKSSNLDYTVKAMLSIKGITKEITVPVSVENVSNQWKLQSNFEINRRDYDVGGGSFVLSKTVKIAVVHYQSLE